jgi:hypothetical protein
MTDDQTNDEDHQISDEVAEELRRLGDKLAQQVRKEAESLAFKAGRKGGDITDKDISDAWARMREEPVSPPRDSRPRPGSVFKFTVMTLAVAAGVFLVFELTATKLPSIGTAALAVGTIGFFYMLASAKVRAGIAAMTKAVVGALGQLRMLAGVSELTARSRRGDSWVDQAGSRWQEIQAERKVGTGSSKPLSGPGKRPIRRGPVMPIESLQIQVQSYRYLRAAIVGLVVVLAAAVFYQTSKQGSFLASVSAYYYTPAQAIFVGALIGLGVSMIALHGMTYAEDTFLNIGGIFAIVMAIVPTGRGADFQTAVQACEKAGGTLLTNRASPSLDCPTVHALQEATRANVENNVAALLIVGGLALLLSLVILIRGGTAGNKAPGRGWALAGFLAALVVWLGGLIALAVSVDWLADYAHYIAAGGLLLAIVLVAAANAYRRQEKPNIKRALSAPREYYYTWAAVALLAGTAVLIVLWLAGVISLFLVEIVVALLFIAFWTIQTVELETRHADHHDETQPGDSASRQFVSD